MGTRRKRPVIVGEAPGPSNDGPILGRACGRRLASLAGIQPDELPRAAKLLNLLPDYPGKRWPAAQARSAARGLGPDLGGRRVLLLGQRVAHAFSLAKRKGGRYPVLLWTGELLPGAREPSWVAVVPHPSGLNRWYNDQDHQEAVAAFLQPVLRGQPVLFSEDEA